MIHETHYLYPDRNDVSLTTYLLDPSPEILKGTPRPLVLICPGGGYLYCSDREAEPVALAFNAMGYHAAVLRYSTYYSTKNKIIRHEEMHPDPHKLFPQPMIEIALAFELFHRYHREWQIDTQAMGLCGFSAGGHNVCMFGTHWHKPLIQQATRLAGEQLRPAFVISGYGLLDIEFAIDAAYASNDSNKIATTQQILCAITGQSIISKEKMRELSPIHAVSKDTPPSFLWATSEDLLVNAQDSAAMALALAREGIAFELHIYEKGGHGLSVANYGSANQLNHLDLRAHQWLSDVEQWLTYHVPLKQFLR